MKILHTADWHIGQMFYGFEREYEHQHFLDWLVTALVDNTIDLLLISGDVFDTANPSASYTKMFYSFINKATKAFPSLQIIITAGNHDSAQRLETPKPLLESSNIHIIGVIERQEDGSIDVEKLIIPVYGKEKQIEAYVLAVPFLRMGDYASPHDTNLGYSDAIGKFYNLLYNKVSETQQEGQAIIAMGHLHASGVTLTDMDRTERIIMGGVECVGVEAFHENIAYTALGHIHKAQKVGGRENVRYSGSPLPMSFSEINYKHQVIILELTNGKIEIKQPLIVPVAIGLLQIPKRPKSIMEVLLELGELPIANKEVLAPFLEVKVLLEGPNPGLRQTIENALIGKHARLAKIEVSYPNKQDEKGGDIVKQSDTLDSLKPLDLLKRFFEKNYNIEIPQELVVLFNEVEQEVGEMN